MRNLQQLGTKEEHNLDFLALFGVQITISTTLQSTVSSQPKGGDLMMKKGTLCFSTGGASIAPAESTFKYNQSSFKSQL